MTDYHITIYGTEPSIAYSSLFSISSSGGHLGKDEDEAVYKLTRIIKNDASLETKIRLTNKITFGECLTKEFMPKEKAQRIFKAVLKRLPSYDLRIDVGDFSVEEFYPNRGKL
jgi:hypothetical protein